MNDMNISNNKVDNKHFHVYYEWNNYRNFTGWVDSPPGGEGPTCVGVMEITCDVDGNSLLRETNIMYKGDKPNTMERHPYL